MGLLHNINYKFQNIMNFFLIKNTWDNYIYMEKLHFFP